MKKRNILITRPIEDAEALAEILKERGHGVFIEPMLDIYVLEDARLDVEKALSKNPQAIILTSGNGARALSHLTDKRDIPVIAVGEASAMAARHRDFKDAFSANGDIKKLEHYIIENCDRDKGSLIHIAGSVVAGDLQGNLEKFGFKVDRIVSYLAKPVRYLSNGLLNKLKKNQLDTVLFYSPRTAKIFVDRIKQEGVENKMENIAAFCLSPRVEDMISKIKWAEVSRAEYPTQSALLDMIEEKNIKVSSKVV